MFNRICKFIICISILLYSCSLESVVIDPDTIGNYYLFCTLAPTLKEQQLILGKSLPEVMPEQITDATVMIQGENQIITMKHFKMGHYRDTQDKLVLNPDEKYTVQIFRDNKRIIYGETQLPGLFEITSPSDGDTLELGLSRVPPDTSVLPMVQWTTSERAKYYTVTVDIESGDVWGSFHHTYRNNIYFPDIEPRFSYSDSVNKEIIAPATLYVFARDSSFVFIPYNSRKNWDYAFLDYTREQKEEYLNFYPFSYDSTKVNLTGATGTFSSINTAQIRIYLKIQIDWSPNQ